MELLVVTLASARADKDAELLAHIRLTSDTIRNARGLVASRTYRSRGKGSYYLILTTWNDEESWHKAREQHNPKHLLTDSAAEILTAPPEQWLMHYLWGYSRPAATPILATAHISTIRPDQVEFSQQGWIKGLRGQTTQPTLAFAFLARGVYEESAPPSIAQSTPAPADIPPLQGPVLLNLFCWGNEKDREEFFASHNYQAISKLVSNVGVIKTLPLEPM